MNTLHVTKIGGNVIDQESDLKSFLKKMALHKHQGILVHGGGKIATTLADKLGIAQQMVDGRRITDEETLKIVTMVYAGLLNKQIVALLQAEGIDAIGLSGADLNSIKAKKRESAKLDYGFAGDLDADSVAADKFRNLIEQGYTPVVCAITHDGKGQLLNTNADTIASALAVAMSKYYNVQLNYCFEKSGVLKDVKDEGSLIKKIHEKEYHDLKQQGIIQGGMLPKLENAFDAISKGVNKILLGHSSEIEHMISNSNYHGTELSA